MSVLFELFGFAALAILFLTCCSRYLIRVAVRLLTRQSDRLESLRPACRAFLEEYRRVLRHHREYARLEGRVMER